MHYSEKLASPPAYATETLQPAPAAAQAVMPAVVQGAELLIVAALVWAMFKLDPRLAAKMASAVRVMRRRYSRQRQVHVVTQHQAVRRRLQTLALSSPPAAPGNPKSA